MKVLLVDDDVVLRDMHKLALESAGQSVVVAADGREGLDRILSEEFDVVILDVMLPKIEGLEVLRKMRAMSGKQPIVIMLTSLENDELEKRAKKLGVEKFFYKSNMFPNELVKVVNELKRT